MLDTSTQGSQFNGSSNLSETLQRYGYPTDQKLARTEVSYAYNKIKNEFQTKIADVAERRYYDEAKEAHGKLEAIKSEFKAKVLKEMQHERDEQTQKFHKSSRLFLESLKSSQDEQQRQLDQYVNVSIEQLERDHEIQWENLEAVLAKIPVKSPKYSKMVMEMLKMEKQLIRLSQFEEAKTVRSKIDRVVPREEARFYREASDRLEKQRTKLLQTQQEDRGRLEEKLKNMRWNFLRKKEEEAKIGQRRLDYHDQAMQQSHLKESRLDPELSTVHPSALLAKRRGYLTSASFRGAQLETYMRHEKGKLDPREKSMTVVFADSLVERHDFEHPLADTLTI